MENAMTNQLDGALGENDLGRGFDDVNFLGLDEFGDPTGFGALYGAMIGAGAGTVAAIGYRSYKKDGDTFKSELVGLAVGVLAGAAMVAMPKTRHAGWTAMAASVLSNGLRAAEAHFKGATVNGAQVEYLSGLRGIQAEALNGANAQLLGNSTPPHLLGTSSQVSLMGGPNTQVPMASKYGSTYLNR
jgi:hypothetical protein